MLPASPEKAIEGKEKEKDCSPGHFNSCFEPYSNDSQYHTPIHTSRALYLELWQLQGHWQYMLVLEWKGRRWKDWNLD